MTYIIKSNYFATDSSWTVDYSVSIHITFEKSIFVTYSAPSGTSVEMGTKAKDQTCGHADLIFHVGFSNYTYRCRVHDVLHVSEFE